MKYNYRRPKLYRRKKRFTRARIQAPARVRDVYPSSFFSPIPNQMCLRLRHEEDSLVNVVAQGYGALGVNLTNPGAGQIIGGNIPLGTGVTYPAGMRSMHTLYQRSVVEKVTVTFDCTSVNTVPCYMAAGLITSQDTLYITPPTAISFAAARSRSDWKSYILQSEGGNSTVRHTQTVDIRKLYPNLVTQDIFTTFSDRTGQMNFPVTTSETPFIVMAWSPIQDLQASIALKITVDFHIRFYDLHVLQARNNLQTE